MTKTKTLNKNLGLICPVWQRAWKPTSEPAGVNWEAGSNPASANCE